MIIAYPQLADVGFIKIIVFTILLLSLFIWAGIKIFCASAYETLKSFLSECIFRVSTRNLSPVIHINFLFLPPARVSKFLKCMITIKPHIPHIQCICFPSCALTWPRVRRIRGFSRTFTTTLTPLLEPTIMNRIGISNLVITIMISCSVFAFHLVTLVHFYFSSQTIAVFDLNSNYIINERFTGSYF